MTHEFKADGKDVLSLWLPLENLPSQMYVEGIHDDWEGFRILLRGNEATSGVLRVVFESHLSYRNTDESYLLKIWHTTEKAILGKIFYTVGSSSFIDFFHEMNGNLYTDWEVQHYAIYTVSDCIDVISTTTPIVQWLDSE